MSTPLLASVSHTLRTAENNRYGVRSLPFGSPNCTAVNVSSWAGPRPSDRAVAARLPKPHLGLLSDLQGVVNFDPQIPDRAFKLGVAE